MLSSLIDNDQLSAALRSYPTPVRFVGTALAILLLGNFGCARPATKTQSTDEAYISAPGSVGFEIGPLERQKGSLRIQGMYRSQGKLAKFGIEFGPTRNLDKTDSKDFAMETGEGRFIAEPGSDATVLLADLRTALEAKAVLHKGRRVQALPFTFVNIGDNLSQAPGGGFNVDPPGGWTAIKIFIGQGEQEGEFFLNFNAAIGKGQFSSKEADYGDIVLKQLATVL